MRKYEDSDCDSDGDRDSDSDSDSNSNSNSDRDSGRDKDSDSDSDRDRDTHSNIAQCLESENLHDSIVLKFAGQDSRQCAACVLHWDVSYVRMSHVARNNVSCHTGE